MSEAPRWTFAELEVRLFHVFPGAEILERHVEDLWILFQINGRQGWFRQGKEQKDGEPFEPPPVELK